MNDIGYTARLSVLNSANKCVQRLLARGSTYICQKSGQLFCTDNEFDSLFSVDLSSNPLIRSGKFPLNYRVGKGFRLQSGSTFVIGTSSVTLVEVLRPERICALPTGKATCRVCYDLESEENPLISLCSCIGDTKFIHFNCLSLWINAKLQRHDREITLPKSALMCEICHASYLDSVSASALLSKCLDAGRWGLFEVCVPRHPASFHLLKLDAEGVVVGRSDAAQLYLEDKSVSRKHARVSFDCASVLVTDLQSHCGTWMHTKDELALLLHGSVTLQVAGLTLEVTLQRTHL